MNQQPYRVPAAGDRLTCDDVDVGVRVLAQLHAVAVPLKGLTQLLLHGRRATQAIEAHHLEEHTHTQAGRSGKQNV